MKDFIYELYQNDNFTLWLTVVLIILVILFVIVFFFGKKDEKLEETKRLQKIELESFKKEEQTPVKVEVNKEVEEVPVVDTPKDIVNEEVNVTSFKPDLTSETEEIELPKEKVSVKEEKPLFKDVEEETSPISVSELSSMNFDEKDEELTDSLSSISAIKSEFDKIDIPKEEEKEEKPIFKPSPQIFSSVFVNKNEEEVVTKLDKEEEKPETMMKTFIIEDEDEEMDLPTLKIEDDNDENASSLDNVNGEVYELK